MVPTGMARGVFSTVTKLMIRVSMQSEILNQLGVDPSHLEWQKFALCPETDPAWFFEDYEKDPEIAKQVDNLCLSCPVLKQCLEQGSQGQFGVWGAIYWNGSGKPDAAKNKHKTPEVWSEIENKIYEQ